MLAYMLLFKLFAFFFRVVGWQTANVKTMEYGVSNMQQTFGIWGIEKNDTARAGITISAHVRYFCHCTIMYD